MSEWRRVRLGQVVECYDSLRRPVKGAERRPGPYAYYGASGVVDSVDGYLFDGAYALIAEDGENLRTRKTPIAFLASGKFWVNNHAHILGGTSETDVRYLAYRLQCSDVAGYLTGSTQPKLTQHALLSMAFDWPPLSVQRAIAEVLGALDDKIDANIRQSELVLQMSVAVYGAAVANSRAEVALRDVGAWTSGGTPSTGNPEYWGGPTPWISAASLKSFFVATSDRSVTEKGVLAGTRLAPPGALLFVVRGMSLKSEFRVGIAQRTVAFGQDCKAIVVDERFPSTTVAIGLLARSDEVLTLVDEAGHGTGRLPTDRIQRIIIGIPPAGHIARVENALLALAERGAAAEEEARRLAALREALLPALLAGTLHVRDVGAFVSEAV